jgi:acetyltransferase-like isoleucine patch superfamily enzyme
MIAEVFPLQAGEKMSIRRVTKRFVSAVATVVVLPCIALAKIESWLTSSEALFGACGAALSLFPGPVGAYLRLGYYRFTLQKCSWDVYLNFGIIIPHRSTEIGRFVSIGTYSVIGTATIGDNVQIASRASLISGRYQHESEASGDLLTTPTFQRIHIGANAWIGEGAIVASDVGRSAIVAAGAVVFRGVPDGRLAVGNPARALPRFGSNKPPIAPTPPTADSLSVV